MQWRDAWSGKKKPFWDIKSYPMKRMGHRRVHIMPLPMSSIGAYNISISQINVTSLFQIAHSFLILRQYYWVYYWAHENKTVFTDLAFEIHGCYARIAPRSGMAELYCIDVCAGVVDPNFKGHIWILLFNRSRKEYKRRFHSFLFFNHICMFSLLSYKNVTCSLWTLVIKLFWFSEWRRSSRPTLLRENGISKTNGSERII